MRYVSGHVIRYKTVTDKWMYSYCMLALLLRKNYVLLLQFVYNNSTEVEK